MRRGVRRDAPSSGGPNAKLTHHVGTLREGESDVPASRLNFGETTRSANKPTAQVNTHNEDDEPETPTSTEPRHPQPIPQSPPPSFHSRASSLVSRGRHEGVDSALADAFDADDDDSDDEPDDRQRLVRGNSSGSSGGTTPPSGATSADDGTRPRVPGRQVTELPQVGGPATQARVYGSGIQSDGVFSNLSAKPERGEGEKEELPPVCPGYVACGNHVLEANLGFSSHMNKLPPMPLRRTGRRPFSRRDSAGPTKSTSTACRSGPYSVSSGTL